MRIETTCRVCKRELTMECGDHSGIPLDLIQRLAQSAVCQDCVPKPQQRKPKKPVEAAEPKLPYKDQ